MFFFFLIYDFAHFFVYRTAAKVETLRYPQSLQQLPALQTVRQVIHINIKQEICC